MAAITRLGVGGPWSAYAFLAGDGPAPPELCDARTRSLMPRRTVRSLMPVRQAVSTLPRRTVAVHCDHEDTP